MTTRWTRAHTDSIGPSFETTRVFGDRDAHRMLEQLYVWDLWPVRGVHGEITKADGRDLWMALSAPSELEPSERHDVARIRLISRDGSEWADHEDLFPVGTSLGSREWAGCATHWPDGTLDVLYTAAGRRNEAKPTFAQRIVRATGRLDPVRLTVSDWSEHTELLQPGDFYFSTANQMAGEPGFIKAFRDPFRFRDPRSGETVVLFTASMIESSTEFNGAIGIAAGSDLDHLELRPPLLTADGVNNELERPHLVFFDDRYYLFFSTQARTFHPEVDGVTGLYGFVSDDLHGDWEPLNGSGLIVANPAAEPFQAYSWLVLNDLSVCSFVDFHSLGGRTPERLEQEGKARIHFGGTMAPIFNLELGVHSGRPRAEP